MRERRSLLVVGGVGALLLAGIVVALLAARQPETRFAANSPQGTVATYFRLLQEGKVDQAFAMTSFEDSYHVISPSDFHQQFDGWSQTSHRVTAVSTTTTGSTASVTVDISAFSGGTFGASDRTHRATITLARKGSAWRITGPQWLGYF
ncbi:MAG: hypothetical protein NVSMB65_18880 [Chloroflexota bacterium]